MLAPLLQWRPILGADTASGAMLTLGRGQLLGLCGPGWREALMAFASTARESAAPFAEVEVDEGRFAEAAAGLASGAPLLWLVAWNGAPLAARLAPLLTAAEQLARRGGGMVIGADEFSGEAQAQLTRVLKFPLRPATEGRRASLLDDQGMTVNFLRQGDWGAFYFPLPLPGWSDCGAVRLSVKGAGVNWLSKPGNLEPWRLFVPHPTACTAACVVTWPPGNYTATLRIDRSNGRSTDVAMLEFAVRATDPPYVLEDAPEDGPHLQWRFSGLPELPRQPAALSLRLPPRDRLRLGERDEEYLLYGWHKAESAGQKKFRRWIMGEASAALGGAGKTLSLGLYDHRPRRKGNETSTLVVEIDGQTRHEFSWREAGYLSFDIPWIGDGLSHEVRLLVTPTWSPAEDGGDDLRELGVLVEKLQVVHG